MVKDYGHLFAHDPAYAKKAERVAALARDPVEIVGDEWKDIAAKVAMDRGSQTDRLPPPLHAAARHEAQGPASRRSCARSATSCVPVAESHLCCGSAGTYSILQPALSEELKQRKLAALQVERPAMIVSSNIGCQTHLASGTTRPVRHWIEVLDDKMIG